MEKDYIFEAMEAEFCARLCPLEALLALDESHRGYDLEEISAIRFPVGNPEVHKLLTCFGYADLLKRLLASSAIHPSVSDIFRSELGANGLAHTHKLLRNQRNKINVFIGEEIVIAQLPNFLLDLVLPAASQFHSEIELQTDHFAKMLRAVGGRNELIFLNAKGSSRLSNAIMIWVASNLGISIKYGSDAITGVI